MENTAVSITVAIAATLCSMVACGTVWVLIRFFLSTEQSETGERSWRERTRRKLVVVGNGMAGARVVEEILKRAPDRFDIVMFGAEPYGNYNRILLSNVLNGSQAATDIFMNPLSWYRENGIRLHAGVKATRIDRERHVVVGSALAERSAGVQRRRGARKRTRRRSKNLTTT